MSVLDCTCVIKTWAAARVGDPLVRRHRTGCPARNVEVIAEFHMMPSSDLRDILLKFQQRLMTVADIQMPRWILRGEPEPLALVKVGCTALVRVSR